MEKIEYHHPLVQFYQYGSNLGTSMSWAIGLVYNPSFSIPSISYYTN